ncbi:MAG: AMP-binding protein, partial [Candidatus Sericytochromatia bacterium]|nr:AMP-binding protein [Candidatus Tanganyikabacteria bacterium]
MPAWAEPREHRSQTLGGLLASRAASGAPAIVTPGGGEPEVRAWRDVAAAALGVAGSLRERGLEPLEAVALRSREPEAGMIAALGVWLAGGIAVFLDPDAPADHQAAQLAHAECRFVLEDADVPELAAGPPVVEPADQAPGDVACYAHVSPPGERPLLAVKLTHGALCAAGAGLAAALALSEGQRVACGWPA